MRLESARFHELGPFPDFVLDVASAQGPIVGILAPNGTGKTFSLEAAVYGALYRDMPTQGTLVSRAKARDSFEESTIVYGKRWQIRHLIDAVSRNSKTVVLDDDGQPAYEGDKIPQFKAWAARHLPDRDVLSATTFAIQKSDGFLGLGSAERIDVILRAIHLARIERAAARARRYEADTLDKLKAVRQRIEDARQGAPALDEAAETMAVDREALAIADQKQADARARLLESEEQARTVAEVERRATDAKASRDRMERELAAARERSQAIDDRIAENDADEWEEIAADLQAELEGSRAGVAWLEAEERALSAERAELEARFQLFVRTDRERFKAETDLKTAEQLVDETRELIARSEELRRAAAVSEAVTREIATATERERENALAWVRAGEDITRADSRLQGLQRRRERAEEATKGRAAVEAAERDLPALKERHAAALELAAECERRIADLHAEQLNGATKRIEGLEDGHRLVAERSVDHEEARGFSRCSLEDSSTAARAAEELPARLAGAEAEHRAAVAAAVAASDAATSAARSAARRLSIDAADAELGAVEVEAAEATTERDRALAGLGRAWVVGGILRLRTWYLKAKLFEVAPRAARAAELAGVDARLEERQRAAVAARATVDRLVEELVAIPPPPDEDLPEPYDLGPKRRQLTTLAKQAESMALRAVAERTAANELEPQNVDAWERVNRLTAELEALAPVPDVPEAPDVALAKTLAEDAERLTKELTARVARGEQRLEQARAAAERTKVLDAERLELEAELADWTRLALDFGRDGIQSAEVDSVGAELTELANDLLRNCLGPRYSVSIETKRETADGKREIDECQVRVIDTVTGEEKEGREFSGGEQVLLNEAISLALTMLACKRAHIEGATLVRDESGAALDPQNARAYVAMLRRAVKFTNADKVLIVSHLPAVQALCDSVIRIPSFTGSKPGTEAAA